MEQVVKCMICKKGFTGIGAGEHTKETGHNEWELLLPEGKRDNGRKG